MTKLISKETYRLLKVFKLRENPLICHVPKLLLHCRSVRFDTIYDLYNEWAMKFDDDRVPEPSVSSGYIAAHILGYKTFSTVPTQLLLKPATDQEKADFHRMGGQRLKRMPIQYILGDWDFGGVNLIMRPPVFIPRQETEVLVAKVLEEVDMRLNIQSAVTVLEVGCGTGAITLSLLNDLKNQPVRLTAVDAADHAVRLAQENAQHLSLPRFRNKLMIFKHKIGIDDDVLVNLGPFDIVVSNPPYIPTADMASLPKEILWYEDERALHGGDSGLDTVESIVQVSEKLLTKTGSIWFELDSSHPAILKTLYKDWVIDDFCDMYNVTRFCRLTRAT